MVTFNLFKRLLSRLQRLFDKTASSDLVADREYRASVAANATAVENSFDPSQVVSNSNSEDSFSQSRTDDESDDTSSLSIQTPLISPDNIGGYFHTVSGPATSTLKDGPGVALDSGSAFKGLIELRAASLVGDSHVLEGTRRQDAYAVRILEDASRLEIAVCDGVGSRLRSHEGAAIVATSVVQLAAHNSIDPVGDATAILAKIAKLHDISPVEFSTTLVWVRVDIGSPGSNWTLHLTQYGDGAVKFLRRNGTWRDVTQIPSTAEFDHHSFALPLACHPIQQLTFTWSPEDVLFLASDGISDHLADDTKVGDFLATRWQRPPDRWVFLSNVSFRTKGAGDDRTIVAVWRTDSPSSYTETCTHEPLKSHLS